METSQNKIYLETMDSNENKGQILPPKVSMSKVRDGELMKDNHIMEYMLPNKCQTSDKTDICTSIDIVKHT